MLRVTFYISLVTTHALSLQDNFITTKKMNAEEPQFVEPIGNLTYPIGREATLKCSVSNLGKYKVGWLKAEDQTVLSMHTKVVTHSQRISVSHDPPLSWQLKIRPLRESDRGCYMCQINTSTMMKQIGCIDVFVPPDIINDETSADLAVQEHDNATLVCHATGHPKPKIAWKREDAEQILMKRPNSRDFIRVDTFSGSSLTLWKVDRRQMGAFLCIASNDVPPAVSKRISLSVNFAPTVKVPNQLLGAPLETDVQLECYVEAYPNTINYWVKNRGEMLLDGTKYAIREERSSYKVYMWLTIKNFSKADIGTYNCVSTNSLGKSEGTLRLYEIKLYPNMQGSTNHVSVVSGLKDGSKNRGSTISVLSKELCYYIAFVISLLFLR